MAGGGLAGAAAAAAAAPQLAPAAALTPEQQAAALQRLPGFSPEALAAAQAALPVGLAGQALPLTLPVIGPNGESLSSLVLDPSVLLSTQITGPNGEELSQEQVGLGCCLLGDLAAVGSACGSQAHRRAGLLCLPPARLF